MTRFLCVCMLFWGMVVFSQEKTTIIDLKNEPLSLIIPSIEKQFNVKFSYIDATIVNKPVSLQTNSETSLEEAINILQEQTQLKFEITGKNFITIRKYSKKDTISICGYIYDENNQPLEKIRVFFKGSRTNTTTNEQGYFENKEVRFNTPILISAPGFRQKVLNSSEFTNTNCANIYLINSIETLDEVIIQEYLTKGITQNKRIVNINLKDIEILPGLTEPDILQSIQLTPGVNSPFETASGIYVRGSAPNQNLVLWNGIKTYHQGHLFGMLSAFNPYVVKEVNFSKSGVSAQYGDRVSGIIDIKTEDKIVDRFSGGAGFNMINADAVIHTPIIKDKVSLQISGRRSYTDLLETFTYKQFANRVFQNTTIAETIELNDAKNDFFYEDYNANLIAKISDFDKIEANALYSKNDLDFERSDNLTSFNDNLITENEGYNISWKHQSNNKFKIKTSGYYTRYLLNYQFITTESGNTIETESKKNSVKDFGAALDLSYSLSQSHKILGGYQFSNNNIKYAFVTTTPTYELILDQDDRFLNTHSIYGEYKYEIPRNLYLSVGLRFNNYTELNESFIEPRVFIQKNLSKSWQLNATGEYRSQAVSQIRESVVSDLSLENQVWTLANEEQFPVITSYQFTLGSSFKKHKWYFDIDTYYKQIDNITSLTAGFINPIDNTYHNGESRVYGIDFFLKKRFNRYKTWISYSYINTKNKFEDINNNQSFPGNWNIEHTVKWSHFYKINNFQFSLGWLWHTGKAFTNVDGVDENGNLVILDFGEINGNNLPIYHRLDFSAIYDFKIGSNPNVKYRLGLSVLNLYDRENLLNREFRTTNSLDNRFINSDIVALGITPNLSFRVFW
ncbi:Outer membrane receptor for ferrienterochelin and colicins [Aquimarina amphilecti]|uniref:Outer membrane receptor for ferrienterochelin and colicins n=1 Tax=Aquimarina amphilecti TaxID=1038014 RepID=A0A1H7TL27_AQUAM|nr:TonB-dependent receptor [Aquimarina amphilecti]SEL85592.1 Outer membrane receptor for ferrienterochelin and colicins [Aquimarina amphilecti]